MTDIEAWHSDKLIRKFRTPQTEWAPIHSMDPINDAIEFLLLSMKTYPPPKEMFPGFENVSFLDYLSTRMQSAFMERSCIPEHPQAGWTPEEQGLWDASIWALYFDSCRHRGSPLEMSEDENLLLDRIHKHVGLERKTCLGH